ncbi:peptidoglycan-binding protein [Lachnoclostridium phytofermentans]|uniref:Peptidoglycan-binding domain 1 protein n=1 Tax=Lachnoclostridium phytofermentans (strain ATCC 700394 / DSM 18823 / ISDg) TaxID=357809 RepID=A9KPR6_LACP7|nr:peptidoglycan-binding protein [Lachnoclostridium phytofermentans]ABX41815.1 Peptidoglycan-binding domain 1 protein [Lachnoclostridium phytofermentans ISDg]
MADWDNSRFTYAQVLQGGTGVYYQMDDKLRYADGVKTMQEKLNKAGYNCGTADGKFGSTTDSKVRSFQTANSLTVDGCAGKNTLTKLDAITSGTTPPTSMNATKVDNLINYCKDATADGTIAKRWGYVWGGSGEVYTDDVAKQLYTVHNTTLYDYTYYTVTQINLWKNHRVVDCSGLLRAYLTDKKISLESPVGNYNADKFYTSECSTKAVLTSADYATLPKGCLVFEDKAGSKVHVGVCIGNGKVIHSSGSSIGVVEENLSSRFTHYGIPKFLC